MVDLLMNRLLREGHVVVRFWDGEERSYHGWQGGRPVGSPVHVVLNDPRVVRRLAWNASLAVGEGYMNGQLEVSEDSLPRLFELIATNRTGGRWQQPAWRNANRRGRQHRQIQHHYNVGNDYYRLWLDESMLYSCAYFDEPGMSLAEAQRRKIDHLLRKLQLQPGMRLLDIGCGWGSLAVAAAQQYGVEVVGITLSEEQLAGARARAAAAGLREGQVRFKLCNYQDIKEGEFDRIVSVGMFEHVGRKGQATYFRRVNELLVPGGVSVLHTITQQRSRRVDAWVDKYVFPGGNLPTVSQVMSGLEQQGFTGLHYEDLRQHYAETLRHWREGHQAHREEIIDMFDEVFYLMRDFWLVGSEANFRHGQLGLGQFVFTKGGVGPRTWRHLYSL